jgi:hypothetical protein
MRQMSRTDFLLDNAQVDAADANAILAEDTPTVDEVQKLLADGKELPPGWSLAPDGPPFRRVGELA